MATAVLLFLLSFLSRTFSLEPHYIDIVPQSIEYNDPKSTNTVLLNATTFLHIDYSPLLAPLDMTGKYFGCTFRVPSLEGGRVDFDICSDFNMTNDVWTGAICIPACRDGLRSDITEHDFANMKGTYNWYMLVNITAEYKPPMDLVFSCYTRWKTVSIVGFVIGGTGGVLLLVIICGVWFCPMLFEWTKKSSTREDRDSLEEDYPLDTIHSSASEEDILNIEYPKNSSSINYEEEKKRKFFKDHESRVKNSLLEDDNF